MFILLLGLLIPLALCTPIFPRAETVAAVLSGDGTALCLRPGPWNQILGFFLTNYIARIATFKKTSGYEGYRDYTNVIMSLFVPFVGIKQAASTIARGSRFLGHDDVDRALLAEALCVIVREQGWRPAHMEVVKGCLVAGADERGRKKMERRIRRRRRKEKKMRKKKQVEERRREVLKEYDREHGGPEMQELNRGRRSGERNPQLLGNPGTYSHEDEHLYSRPSFDDAAVDSDNSAPDLSHHPSSDEDENVDSRDWFSSSTATLVINAPGIETINPEKYKIQGHFNLPPSYTLAKLPPGTELKALAVSTASKGDIVISNSYGVVKAFTGIVQIVSSLYALYTAYGQQTRRFGYAAFGFTVLPYTVMSVLNTIANLVEASYDCLFLVRSDVMLEAEFREGGEFVGEVAELVPASKDIEIAAAGVEFVDLLFRRSARGSWSASEVDEEGHIIPGRKTWRVHIPSLDGSYNPADDPRAKILVQPVGQSYAFDKTSHLRSKRFRERAVVLIMVFALVVPYAVIGGISRFKAGGSNFQQRVFMMGWLVVGQCIGALSLVIQTQKKRMGEKGKSGRRAKAMWKQVNNVVEALVVVLGFAFAVGGFIEAGRMLRDYGYCIRV